MAGTFASQVSKYCRGAEREILEFRKAVLREFCRRVILRTPVDQGYARGSWIATLDAPGMSPMIADPSGEKAIARVEQVLGVMRLEQRFFFRSTLSYIGVLEYGLYPNPPKGGSGKTENGFSTQAPAGMYRVTLAEMPAILASVRSK